MLFNVIKQTITTVLRQHRANKHYRNYRSVIVQRQTDGNMHEPQQAVQLVGLWAEKDVKQQDSPLSINAVMLAPSEQSFDERRAIWIWRVFLPTAYANIPLPTTRTPSHSLDFPNSIHSLAHITNPRLDFSLVHTFVSAYISLVVVYCAACLGMSG